MKDNKHIPDSERHGTEAMRTEEAARQEHVTVIDGITVISRFSETRRTLNDCIRSLLEMEYNSAVSA